MKSVLKISGSILIIGAILLSFYAQKKNTINLSEEERLFLSEKKLSISIFPNSPPYLYIEDDRVVGIFVDFISLIEERLRCEFDWVYFNDWDAVMKAGKNKSVDIISEIQATVNREEFLYFTKSLIKQPHTILVNKSVKGAVDINQLDDKPVAVVEGYAVHEYLVKNYPHLKLSLQKTEKECLTKLSSGEVYAYIARHAVATYMIQALGFPYVRIAGEIPYENEIGFAVNAENKILVDILNKAIDSITTEEYKSIVDEWLYDKYTPFYEQVEFWIFIAFCIWVAFMIMWFFNTLLKRKVQKRTEELKMAKVKAEESDKLKSAFIANMSHEIRTPLNGILGFSDLLGDISFSKEERSTFNDLIKSNANQLMHLVNDIIDISKIESEQLTIFHKEFSVEGLLNELHNKFIWGVKEGVNLKIVMKSDFLICSDEFRVRQVLINFLSNAIKFTSTGTIELGVEVTNKREVIFFVKDTGIGIAAEKQKELFKPFSQVGDFLTRKHGGAGLGLAISYRLAELLGGRLELESSKGEGSTFRLIIPAEVKAIESSTNVEYETV